MHIDFHEGVYFIEESPPQAQIIAPISTRLDGCFVNSQLRNLDDVKTKMASLVKQHGGNAVIGFKYAQKSSFWRSLLSLDDVHWEASGHIAKISD